MGARSPPKLPIGESAQLQTRIPGLRLFFAPSAKCCLLPFQATRTRFLHQHCQGFASGFLGGLERFGLSAGLGWGSDWFCIGVGLVGCRVGIGFALGLSSFRVRVEKTYRKHHWRKYAITNKEHKAEQRPCKEAAGLGGRSTQ